MTDSVFTPPETPSVFTTPAPLPVEADKEAIALELIAKSAGLPVTILDYEERLKKGGDAASSPLAREYKNEQDELLAQTAMQAMKEGDTLKAEEALAAYEAVTQQPPTELDFSRGVLRALGTTATFNKPPVDFDSLSELGKQTARDYATTLTNNRDVAAYWDTRVGELERKVKEQGLGSDFTDWASIILKPFATYIDTRGLGEESFFDGLLESPRSKMQKIKDSISSPSLSVEQRKKNIDAYIDSVGSNLTNELFIAGDIGDIGKHNPNVIASIEAVLDLSIVGSLFRAGGKAGRAMTHLKHLDPDHAAQINKNALVDWASGVDSPYTAIYGNKVDDMITDALPGMVHPTGDVNNAFGKLAEMFESLPESSKSMLDIATVQLLNPDEAAQAVTSLTNKTSGIAGKSRPIVDAYLTRTVGSSVPQYNAIIGKKGSTDGYLTVEGAKSAARSMGLEPADFDVITKDAYLAEKGGVTDIVGTNNGFYIRYKEAVNVEKFTGVLDIGRADRVGPIGEFFRSAADYLTIAPEFQRAMGKRSLIGQHMRKLFKDMPILYGQDSKNFGLAMNYSQKNGWFNSKTDLREFVEARGGTYSDKLWKTYDKYREFSDTEYILRNARAYDELFAKGYNTLDVKNTELAKHLNGERVAGKAIDVPHLMDEAVYDLASSRFIPAGQLTDWQALKDKGWQAYKLADNEVSKHFQGARIFIAPKGTVIRNPLEKIQLGYQPGGHVVYKGSDYAVQQANIITTSTGGKVLYRPSTRYVGNNAHEAQIYVNEMEKARLIYTDFIKTGNESAAMTRFEALGLNRDWTELRDAFKRGDFNPDVPFELSRRGGDIPSMVSARAGSSGVDRFDDLSRELTDLVDTGQMYTSKRGTHLKDLTGKELETVDPITTLDTALANAIDNNTIMQFGNRAMTKWVKQFYPDAPTNRSINDLFNTSVENLGLKTASQKTAAAVTQRAIKRFLNRENSFGRKMKAMLKEVNLDLHEKFPNIPKGLFSAADNILSRNPVAFARTVSFHTALGFLTPTNFIVQTQQAILMASIAATNPTAFVRHMNRGMYMYRALATPDDGNIKQFANMMAKAGDDDATELLRMRVAYEKTGLGIVDDSYAMLDQHTTSVIGYGLARNALKKGLDIGRLPFDMTERLNRGVAFSRAWDELGFNKLTRSLTEQELIDLTGVTNKYAMDMLSTRMSAFQQGFAALPLQFLSYSVRLAEAMLPAAVGGSAKWTAKEKVALFGTMFILYGSDGLPTGGLYQSMTESLFGKDSQAKRLVDKGLLDSLFALAGDAVGTEFNTDIGAKAGASGMIRDTFDRIFSDDATLVEAALGASGGLAYPLLRGWGHAGVMAMTSPFESHTLTQSLFHGLEVTKEGITSTRNLFRAIDALDTGTVKTRYGIDSYDVTDLESLGLVFGIPTEMASMMQDKWAEMQRSRLMGSTESAKQLEYYYRKALSATTKEESNAHLAMAALYSKYAGLDKKTKDKVLNKATQNSHRYNDMMLQLYIDTGDLDMHELAKRYEDNK